MLLLGWLLLFEKLLLLLELLEKLLETENGLALVVTIVFILLNFFGALKFKGSCLFLLKLLLLLLEALDEF